jgi:toxin CptA
VHIVLASAAFLVAMLAAATMGVAIQRGATCTVAAIDEIVSRRTCNRLVALLEASIWVAGGLLVVDALHLGSAMPPGHALTMTTVAGGLLLGVGAYVNGACVFGAIARFGSGDWSYLATPIGIYAGSVAVAKGFAPAVPRALDTTSPVLALGAWLALPFAAFVAWRVVSPLAALASRRSATGARLPLARHVVRELGARAWEPHAATLVIGIAFVILFLVVGTWDYTSVLAEIARDMWQSLPARLLLLLALFLGAVYGGYRARRFSPMRMTVKRLARCFAGGAMMGAGGLIVPGHNDGLILIGMPLLWPYAWVAFATMCVSIAGALVLETQLTNRARGASTTRDSPAETRLSVETREE